MPKGHSCYPPASQRVGSVNTQEGRGCSVVVQTVHLPKCAAAHLPREKGRLGIASFLLFLLFGARGHLCRFELVWRQPGLQMKFRYKLTSQAVMQRLPPGAVLGFFNSLRACQGPAAVLMEPSTSTAATPATVISQRLGKPLVTSPVEGAGWQCQRWGGERSDAPP